MQAMIAKWTPSPTAAQTGPPLLTPSPNGPLAT